MSSKLILPGDDFTPIRAQRVVLQRRGPIHLTDYGWDWVQGEIKSGRLRWKNDQPMAVGASGQLSSFAEQTVLNHITGNDNASWLNLAPTFLALCTTTPTSSSTGSTIAEATYTGYARQSMTAAGTWATAATGTAPATISNAAAITFAACTASTSTIIGLAACTAATVGNVLYWCSCASTVISATQTPATVAIAGLSVSET